MTESPEVVGERHQGSLTGGKLVDPDGMELGFISSDGKGKTKPVSADAEEAGDMAKLQKNEAELSKSADAQAVPQKTADEGIQIYVEKSTAPTGDTNKQGSVSVLSPWPAKPISPPPSGWQFVAAPIGIKPYTTSVKLSSGNMVDLSITPFVLVPMTDGLDAIRIVEPGYDPALHYSQKDTVGSMLQKSTVELEENEKQAADTINRLQQLLSSLPQ